MSSSSLPISLVLRATVVPNPTWAARVRTMLLLVVLTAVTPGSALAQEIVAGVPEVGPEKGSLVIVGGAMRSAEIYERFIALAGGPDAHIVLVPTAGGAEEYDEFFQGMNAWREHGARNLTLLHTTDPAEADGEIRHLLSVIQPWDQAGL